MTRDEIEGLIEKLNWSKALSYDLGNNMIIETLLELKEYENLIYLLEKELKEKENNND